MSTPGSIVGRCERERARREESKSIAILFLTWYWYSRRFVRSSIKIAGNYIFLFEEDTLHPFLFLDSTLLAVYLHKNFWYARSIYSVVFFILHRSLFHTKNTVIPFTFQCRFVISALQSICLNIETLQRIATKRFSFYYPRVKFLSAGLKPCPII